MDHHTTDPWTSRRLLAWTGAYLTKKGVDSPRLAAEMLLAHVLEVSRLKLYMDPDRPASDVERAAFRQLVERAADHEPVDYLTGQAPFFSLLLRVNPSVLIPRPSTETLAEHIVQHARCTPGFASPLIIDIGTGSGAIAIALAKHIKTGRVIATDISPAALEVARENAQRHDVADRIDFRLGDFFEPIATDQRASYLVSNPPYISDAEWADVAPNVKDYEPTLALRGGTDGLEFIQTILAGASDYMDKPGQLVLEFAASQEKQVLALAKANPGLANADILDDHEGLPRVLVADMV